MCTVITNTRVLLKCNLSHSILHPHMHWHETAVPGIALQSRALLALIHVHSDSHECQLLYCAISICYILRSVGAVGVIIV